MIFDEKFLQQEIENQWGKHGAHAEIYRMLLNRAAIAAPQPMRWNPNKSAMEPFNYSDDQKGSAE